MRRLLRNSARCLRCNQEIVSRHRHDFVTCSCGGLSVDGGLAYLKRSTDYPPGTAGGWSDTSLYEDDNEPGTEK